MGAFKQIIAFRCTNAGCRRPPFVTEKAAQLHADTCIHNPEKKTCATCAHDFGPGVGCAVDAREEATTLVKLCALWEAA
ncbi:hypothetical protein 3Fb_00002 [Ralstonia phage Eline]|uniref:Uncharacterized protein n=2 Tax=Cimandefvirus TaxID=2843366 RepID=A0A7G5B9N2_9CAUD|nr:hypothetical protein KMC45_gp02 [Ralstonia phage Eline]YP_010078445.1 hypothetical protein KMC47_gp71 [Ralstonia phage Gerry]QMV33005.1 hypothetical protein 3Fb_00002 [Ralstonia phage Eline]QMV33212.1 hypothetical protein 23F_00051 [Ralstonia phage Gerry]